MKSLVLHFEDSEFEELLAVKADLTWRELMLTLIRPKEVNRR